jgi:DNA-binding transcriptional MerR regulator
METRSYSGADAARTADPDASSDPNVEPGCPPAPLPQAQYSIASVSKLTGISCHTLRVWERRYGFPLPSRSRAGHRRYDREQVQTLLRLSRLSRSGRHSIGELIALLKKGRLDLGEVSLAAAGPVGDETIAELIDRLIKGDSQGAEREYARFSSRFDPSALMDRVISPALVEAGEGWYRHNYSVSNERLITVFLRRKLGELIEAARRSNTHPAHSVIAGTVLGDRHKGGVLMFSVAMELRGWRVHNLGVDLPVPEFRAAVQDLRPSALALSFVLSRNIKKRFQELEKVTTMPIFVGGRSILNYQSLARHFGLIPLPGPIGKSAEQFQSEYNLWCRRHSSLA